MQKRTPISHQIQLSRKNSYDILILICLRSHTLYVWAITMENSNGKIHWTGSFIYDLWIKFYCIGLIKIQIIMHLPLFIFIKVGGRKSHFIFLSAHDPLVDCITIYKPNIWENIEIFPPSWNQILYINWNIIIIQPFLFDGGKQSSMNGKKCQCCVQRTFIIYTTSTVMIAKVLNEKWTSDDLLHGTRSLQLADFFASKKFHIS